MKEKDKERRSIQRKELKFEDFGCSIWNNCSFDHSYYKPETFY